MEKNKDAQKSVHICNKCKCQTDLFFCPECGNIIDYPDYLGDDEKQRKALASFISQMVETAKKNWESIGDEIDKTALSQLAYRKYFQHIAYLQQLCQSDFGIQYFGGNGEDLFEQMSRFGEKCMQHECQIAVIGTIKAGKSMFINSFLDEEIASTYPTPETASLTKFRASTQGDYVKITFYTTNEWNQLWSSVMESKENSLRKDNEDFVSEYNALHAEEKKSELLDRKDEVYYTKEISELKQIVDKFTSARYPEHFFAKEVEVGLSKFNAPQNVVFVDTPGLNDPVKFRTDITRRYLHSANVVLLCVKASSAELRSDELEQMAGIFAELRYQKDRIYLLGTQIDMQSKMIQYWDTHTYPEFLKYLSKSMFYGDNKTAKKQIFPVSAYYYNLINKARNNVNVWNDTNYRKILREMVRRCIDLPELEDLLDDYCEEEARKRYISPQQAFYSSIQELEAITNVPNIRKTIMEIPVKNAERIVCEDIVNIYRFLCEQISGIAKDVNELHGEVIEEYRNNDIISRVTQLDKSIKDKGREYDSLKTALQDALNTLKQETKLIINDSKNE